MNLKPYYPSLQLGSIASLVTLRQQMDLHTDYLESEHCPYDEDTREQLARVLAIHTVEKVVEVEKIVEIEKRVEVVVQAAAGGGKRGPKLKAAGVDIDVVTKEIDEIRLELRQMKTDGKQMQVGDRIQISKIRAQLIEKLLQMLERSQNVKKMSVYQSVVMGILDDLMADDQRQAFMKRLEPFADAE